MSKNATKHPDPVLPRKPSELIRVAIADAQDLDRDIYVPSYGDWHQPTAGGQCVICDAGTVMAGTLAIPSERNASPWELASDGTVHPRDASALSALDAIRSGNYASALHCLGHEQNDYELSNIPRGRRGEYTNWDEFRDHMAEMEEIADAFEDLGL